MNDIVTLFRMAMRCTVAIFIIRVAIYPSLARTLLDSAPWFWPVGGKSPTRVQQGGGTAQCARLVAGYVPLLLCRSKDVPRVGEVVPAPVHPPCSRPNWDI